MGKALDKVTKEYVPGRNGRRKTLVRRNLAPGAQSLPSSSELLRYYEAMSGALGPMRWWPAKTPFEVIVGAILTQSTAWGNVERAIANLRAARVLTPSAMLRVGTPRLAALVRPSGYFRQKAKKLKAFVRFLQAGYADRTRGDRGLCR